MKTITIKVTEDDVAKAQGYFSNTGCVISQALKRNGFDNVIMGGFGPEIDGIDYIYLNRLTENNLLTISSGKTYPQNALGLTFDFVAYDEEE